jgi:hypothetical protein
MNWFLRLFGLALVSTSKQPASTSTREGDKAALSALLNDSRFEFRTMGALSKAIGNPAPDYLRGLLVELGTRAEFSNPDLIGLISRVGARARQRGDY